MKITLTIGSKDLCDRMEAALARAGLHVVQEHGDNYRLVDTPRVLGKRPELAAPFGEGTVRAFDLYTLPCWWRSRGGADEGL